MTTHSLKALSLFSGAGGDTLGMSMAGVDVVGFVEIDPTFVKTHLHNIPDSVCIGNDITQIPDETFLPYRGKIDIIFAGFPCQGYSHAGKKDPDDVRNNLYREFIRITRIIKPTWIIGENVKRLTTMKDKDGNPIVNRIIGGFEEIGYSVTKPTIIQCVKYGIPQKRERCFFIGYKGKKNRFSFTNILTTEAFSLLPIIEETLEGAIIINNIYNITNVKQISKNIQPTGRPATNLIKCFNQGNLSFGKRSSAIHSEILDLSKQAKTIICTYGRMPRQFVPLCNDLGIYYLRQLTVRELQQIQGFPASYKFLGSQIEQITQIGNSVPPPIVCAITKQIVSLR